ncbi:MFS transporter [Akanthomyces lecanii RCEF 1005]|uniref:MFS transporter n=1 Tax=Akanthomyces lecanii RCEF 1005 TaxID=1081108 RepID=A0A162KTM5_CORDF|nr:MFS transporter [Akanthomyces lecanii RCEF 1005]
MFESRSTSVLEAEKSAPFPPHNLEAEHTNADPERNITGWRWFAVCVAVFSANILYGLDTTIAADIQGPIAASFDSVDQLGWLGIGFTLGSTACILPLGKAFGIFDAKWLFLGCTTMFAAGSALCGAAPNMNAMIIGRVWAGAGGAGMYLGNLNLLTMMTRPKEQPLYMGLVGLVYGTGCILGPIVGGTLSDSAATWRWAFYLNLLIFALMSPIYIFMLPSLPQQVGTTFNQKLKRLDWLGIVLNMAAYLTFVMIFTFAGSQWAWDDHRIVALFVVFGICLIAFCVTQYFATFTTKEDRLFPCRFVTDKHLLLLYICMACGGASLFVAVYYLPLYFQYVHGENGTMSAVRLLPFVCFYIASILLVGYLMPRTGYYMVWYLVSGIFITVGAALMYTVHAETPVSNIYGYSVILGLGMATSQSGYSVGAESVAAEDGAEVIQFMNISQGQAQLLGLVIASSIFQSLTFRGLKKLLSESNFTDADIRAAVAGAQSKVLGKVSPELRAKGLEVIVKSINDAYILAIAAGALYVICSLFLKPQKSVRP